MTKRRRPQGREIRVYARVGKPGATIARAADACHVLRDAAGADRESFYVIPVDVRGRSLGVEEVAKGTLSSVQVHPREVFKSAIAANASAIYIGHNHPSGNPEPSPQDIALTRRLADAGRLLGIPIRDHVIVAAEGCTSLNDHLGGAGLAYDARELRTRARAAARAGMTPSRGVALAVGLLLGATALALAARS